MSRTGGDLCLLHRGWHWHWITVIHGDSPATWHVGLHKGSTVANGVLPAYGCDQFWYWLHITQEFFNISHKQFGSDCARVCPWYRHRVPLTLHADDENVDSHVQWKRHDNVSAASSFWTISLWKPKWAAALLYERQGGDIPASWRQSSAERRGVLVQVTDSANWEQNMFFCCFRVKGNHLQTKAVWLSCFVRVAVENLKSQRVCCDRDHFRKLTWNWFRPIATGVEKTSRKCHAGIAADSKDISL